MGSRLAAGLLLLVAVLVPAAGQRVPAPDLGAVGDALDEAGGATLPPILDAIYNATGNNITREDVRIFADLNFTKGDVELLGFLVGSGRAEVQARLEARLEMRVISSDRLRALVQDENAYNMSAENATFLSEVFIPADVFRASLTAEVVRQFQEEQERSLADYLRRTLPEMNVFSIDFGWNNTAPGDVAKDASLTEPPIVVRLELVVQYLRTESLASLLHDYLDRDPAEKEKKESKKEYVRRVKQESGDPLRSRDFFSAAAYTQLLNLSMQPGWSLDLRLHVPEGYSFTYFNDAVQSEGERTARLRVDAHDSDDDVHKVFLASITNKRAVALVLFSALWVVGLAVALPARFLYGRYRLARLGKDK